MSYRERLLKELNRRKAQNPAFSLRAFARSLGVSTTALSQVISGKRDFSRQNASRVAEKLRLTPSEYDAMMREIGGIPDYDGEELKHLRLEDDRFQLIVDWFHFAILSLARLPGVRAEAKHLAERLGVSVSETQEALGRLIRLELIDVVDGCLQRTSAPITTSRDRPSTALRLHNRQMLEKAVQSLDEVSVERRDIGSVTMAVDIEKLGEAKELIKKFKMDMVRLMETSKPNAVYNLGVNLFPLCKTESTDA